MPLEPASLPDAEMAPLAPELEPDMPLEAVPDAALPLAAPEAEPLPLLPPEPDGDPEPPDDPLDPPDPLLEPLAPPLDPELDSEGGVELLLHAGAAAKPTTRVVPHIETNLFFTFAPSNAPGVRLDTDRAHVDIETQRPLPRDAKSDTRLTFGRCHINSGDIQEI
jgi:hypothetical protein